MSFKSRKNHVQEKCLLENGVVARRDREQRWVRLSIRGHAIGLGLLSRNPGHRHRPSKRTSIRNHTHKDASTTAIPMANCDWCKVPSQGALCKDNDRQNHCTQWCIILHSCQEGQGYDLRERGHLPESPTHRLRW